MEQALEAAQNEAEKGNPDTMRRFLTEAAQKALSLRLNINARIKDIEQTGYAKALELDLQQAIGFAEQGNMKMAILYLDLAASHASHLSDTAQNRVKEARSQIGASHSD